MRISSLERSVDSSVRLVTSPPRLRSRVEVASSVNGPWVSSPRTSRPPDLSVPLSLVLPRDRLLDQQSTEPQRRGRKRKRHRVSKEAKARRARNRLLPELSRTNPWTEVSVSDQDPPVPSGQELTDDESTTGADLPASPQVRLVDSSTTASPSPSPSRLETPTLS